MKWNEQIYSQHLDFKGGVQLVTVLQLEQIGCNKK